MENENNKFSILVLTDFSESSKIALRNAAKFAKLVNGNVRVYHVNSLRSFSEEENQLSLSLRLRNHRIETHNVAKEMLAQISEEEGLKLNFSMDFGNVKNCVLNKVNTMEPDLVILGKRRPNPLNFLGDRLTQFVIENCNASILISSSIEELHSFSDLSLGFYGERIAESNLKIISHLQATKNAVKYFGIQNQSSTSEIKSEPKEKGRSFIFPQEGMKAIEALTSYVSRTNTQLFCISKSDNMDPQPVKQMVNRMDVPILIYK